MAKPNEIEKQNLEAHVELCAIRYSHLESKLENLEHRMDKLETHLVDIKGHLSKKVAGTDAKIWKVVLTLLSIALAGIIGFLYHSI